MLKRNIINSYIINAKNILNYFKNLYKIFKDSNVLKYLK